MQRAGAWGDRKSKASLSWCLRQVAREGGTVPMPSSWPVSLHVPIAPSLRGKFPWALHGAPMLWTDGLPGAARGWRWSHPNVGACSSLAGSRSLENTVSLGKPTFWGKKPTRAVPLTRVTGRLLAGGWCD